MELENLERRIIKYLTEQYPHINLTGAYTFQNFEYTDNNLFYINVNKIKDEFFDITIVKYNSNPANKTDEDNMANLYNALINWNYLASAVGQKPYRNFILKKDEIHCGWIKETSNILQCFVIFKINNEGVNN